MDIGKDDLEMVRAVLRDCQEFVEYFGSDRAAELAPKIEKALAIMALTACEDRPAPATARRAVVPLHLAAPHAP